MVIFDPARVADAATFEKPHAYGPGIPHVLVNGVAVANENEHTGETSGGALLSAKN